MTRYPNLLELRKYHSYGEPVMCDHAQFEPELLRAVLEEGEPLLPAEIRKLAQLYECPVGVLDCTKVIMLDMGRWRHRKTVAEVDNLYIRLKCMAREGDQKAEKYLEWADQEQQRFMKAAYSNKLSYCHYWGTKKQLSLYIDFAAPRPKRRKLAVVSDAGAGGR